MRKTVKKIKIESKEKNLDTYIYEADVGKIEDMRSNNSSFVGFNFKGFSNFDVVEYRIMEPEEYNRNLWISFREKKENPIMVVLVRFR